MIFKMVSIYSSSTSALEQELNTEFVVTINTFIIGKTVKKLFAYSILMMSLNLTSEMKTFNSVNSTR